MTQVHEYEVLGMGECGDEYGKNPDYPRGQLHFSGNGAFTLADCKLQCDLYPNCQGFTIENDDHGVTKGWCQLHSAAYKARGNNRVFVCYSKANLKVHVYIDIYFYKCIQIPGASDQPAVHDPKV